MSAQESPRQSGRFVTGNRALPAVKIDVSQWPRGEGPRTSGQFESENRALRAVDAKLHRVQSVYLELDLTFAEEEPLADAAVRIASLVNRLDDLERSMGGAGIKWEKERSQAGNGKVQICLSALEPENACDRFTRLVAVLSETIRTVLDIATASARLYREDEDGKHVQFNFPQAI